MPTPLRAVLERLFEDEGLLSTNRSPMADALAAHARVLEGPYRRLVGPFVCPASRIDELGACVAAGLSRPTAVAVVGRETPASWRRVFATAGLVHVEAPLGAPVPAPPGRVARYAQIARPADVEATLDAVAAAGARVAVRGGRIARDRVTGHRWLAAVLVGSAERGLVVKAGAGPVHAYGPVDGPGPDQGIVNLLAGAGAAQRREPVATVAALLAAGPEAAVDLAAATTGARDVLAAIGTPDVAAAAGALAAGGLL